MDWLLKFVSALVEVWAMVTVRARSALLELSAPARMKLWGVFQFAAVKVSEAGLMLRPWAEKVVDAKPLAPLLK